jgi:TDG/mug DNA glycosylase family protein
MIGSNFSNLWNKGENNKLKSMIHTLEPVCDQDAKILIVGTFPSVKSREIGFYYYHPQNRFWKVISLLLNVVIPASIEEKKEMLLKNNIAIWDVIYSCDIKGSSDNSIQNVVPNDIKGLVDASKIKRIYANGTKAYDLYNQYIFPQTKIEIMKLPSTSPANASYSLQELVEFWRRNIQLK